MRPIATALLLVLGAPAAAMNLGMAKMAMAEPGETQSQVCGRAMAAITEQLHDSLFSVIRATNEYKQRLRLYQKQGYGEADLRAAYLDQLHGQVPREQSRRWNGKRCVVRANYQGDVEALARSVPRPELAAPPTLQSEPDDDQAPPAGMDSRTWALFQTSRNRSELARVMSVIAGVRMRISEYYLNSGDWPEDLQQMDIAPEQLVGPNIKRAYLLRDGMLKVELDGPLAQHSLNTWPVDSGIRGLEWKCTTDVKLGPHPFCRQVD
ncbi:MAG: pilin [Alcanivorax sp.]|nr:pilin [Alcanivorax sp.]